MFGSIREFSGKKVQILDKVRTYIAIDLKSFFASVECVERQLDPMTTNLVVADESRTSKTICLAVSPALKSFGVPGRPRLFEVEQIVKRVNGERRRKISPREFSGSSNRLEELQGNPTLAVDYLIAPPRMAKYMEMSTKIYRIYLQYIAPEDIHVYSIDEVFMDVTEYLQTYGMTAKELAMKMIREVLSVTGITATAGIGTNLYLCKIAMDIVAKHMPPDRNGVRIAELDERSYRELLWAHEPITDFWRVGSGYAKKLREKGLYTMGDVARCSLGEQGEFYNEDLLYDLFGVNAELLIDHAWGWEPCTIKEIKEYKPKSNSLGSGQVLQCPYTFEKARIIVQEMTDQLVLELVEKGMVTDQVVLTIGYDIENISQGNGKGSFSGEVTMDRYGRKVPKQAHGSENLQGYTSSTKKIMEAMLRLYDRIVDRRLLVRRVNITANHILYEENVEKEPVYEQMDLFTDYEAKERQRREEEQEQKKERELQKAMLSIKKKYGKNAILKGTNFHEGATAVERNKQIGGHKA